MSASFTDRLLGISEYARKVETTRARSDSGHAYTLQHHASNNIFITTQTSFMWLYIFIRKP